MFALTLSVYLFTASGSLTTSDANATFELTQNLVDRGDVSLSPDTLGREAFRGADGRHYSPFGIGQSLYNIPFYLVANAIVRATGLRIGKADTLPKAIVAMGQTVIAALLVWEIYILGVLLTGDVTAAALGAVTMAFGSLLWPYATFGFNQPLAAASLTGAVVLTMGGLRDARTGRLALAGSSLGVGLLTRHEVLLAVPVFALWIWWRPAVASRVRLRGLVACLVPIVVGVLIWSMYNAHRFASPWNAGQVDDRAMGFWSPIGAGLAGLLFSPAASLFLYSPVALPGLLGLATSAVQRRRDVMPLAALVALFAVFYASLGNWIGGRSYGGRYLILVLPLLGVGWTLLLASRSAGRRMGPWAVCLAVGALVQLPGFLQDYGKTSAGAATALETTAQRAPWRWDVSPLAVNTRALLTAVPANVSYVTGRVAPPTIERPLDNDDREFSGRLSFSLNLWWMYLFYLGVLPPAGLAVVVLCFTVWIAVCAFHLGRQLRAARG